MMLFLVFENTLWRGFSRGSRQLLLHYLVTSSISSVPHPALPVGPHFVFFRSLTCSSFRFQAAFTFSWCPCADVNFPSRFIYLGHPFCSTTFRLASAWASSFTCSHDTESCLKVSSLRWDDIHLFLQWLYLQTGLLICTLHCIRRQKELFLQCGDFHSQFSRSVFCSQSLAVMRHFCFDSPSKSFIYNKIPIIQQQ